MVFLFFIYTIWAFMSLDNAHAELKKADPWFCVDESGRRNDNVLWACGVAEDLNEGQARSRALRVAIEEYRTICEESLDCQKGVIIEPKRMTCVETKLGLWKCYRLIEVRIRTKADEKRDKEED